MRRSELILTTAPFVDSGVSTPRVMLDVALPAVAVLLAATWNFGIGALLVVGASTAGSVGLEWYTSRKQRPSPLSDYSALLTGLLLGLTLPPSFPLWMAFLGGLVAIGLGKLVWGGLGQNLFNPALVGRAFLQASFPQAITTWASPSPEGGFWYVSPRLLTPPFLRPVVDATSMATPLGMAKFEHVFHPLNELFLGTVAGSLGETSAALLLLCGLWMLLRRTFDWRLPVSTFLSVAVFSGALHLARPDVWASPTYMLCSGGLMFGAIFMLTDPVTSPTTKPGAWIFGIGVGFLVVLIRVFGGLPEGVMYAILLMNAATPHINRITQPKPFGAKKALS